MKITGIYAVVPSIVGVDEEFTLRFKILTKPYPVGSACWIKPPNLKSPFNLSPRGIRYLDNVYEGEVREIEIEFENKKIRFSNYSGVFINDKRLFGKIQGLRFSEPGVKFIRLFQPDTGIETYSNPVIVMEKPEYRIFWGDLHSQTFFSDGLRCPEELYTFARDEAFLDFFSVSDHSEWITDRQWEYFCSVAGDFNEDGRFVTLIAQEWTDHNIGHRNIYYPGNTGPVLRAGIDTIEDVYEIAFRYKALVIPHHSANAKMGVNWNIAHNPEVERLVEIYSVWGNSEMNENQGNTRPIKVLGGEKIGQHVVDALDMGYRFGFVGGGDIHDGRPGDELHSLQDSVSDYKNLYRQGITAVKAEKLDRKNIFNGLYNRRCYATSNIRAFFDFFINGIESGNEIDEENKLCFKISGVSEVPFKRVVIISDGKVCRLFSIRKNQFNIEFEHNYRGEKYFYVRVERTDGEMAWLSPVWIKKS